MAHIARLRAISLAVVFGAGLSACGDTLGEQAGLGALAGAGAAAIVDGSLATGAVLGAAANVLYCEANSRRC